MEEMSLAEQFEKGGFMMWPILVAGIVVWGIAIERIVYLYFMAGSSTENFIKNLEKAIMAGDLSRAVNHSLSGGSGALGRIIHAGLLKVDRGAAEVQSAIDEAALRELPKIEKRTPYLAMFGNVAMLLGLLGTIIGMIISFGAVSGTSDSGQKSALLAQGISEAMNCTAFGLLTAIPSLLFFALLQGRTQKLVDEINEGAVRVLNMVLAHMDLLQSKSKSARSGETA